jgi:hypothetical protein
VICYVLGKNIQMQKHPTGEVCFSDKYRDGTSFASASKTAEEPKMKRLDIIAFVEAENRDYARWGTSLQEAWPGRTEAELDEMLMKQWEGIQQSRKRNLIRLRKNHHLTRFPKYVVEDKRRLANTGLKRDVQLQKDPKQQDRLTTWLECLYY